MAPSASILFLSYHQLRGPAPRKAPEASPAGGGLRFNVVGSVFSLGAVARRPGAEGDQTVVGRKRDAAVVVEEKSVDEKFEEALRLSCWSS